MTLDLGTRLCDCTLGEYLAAERAVGITTGWVTALLTAVALDVARLLYLRWKRRKLEQIHLDSLVTSPTDDPTRPDRPPKGPPS